MDSQPLVTVYENNLSAVHKELKQHPFSQQHHPQHQPSPQEISPQPQKISPQQIQQEQPHQSAHQQIKQEHDEDYFLTDAPNIRHLPPMNIVRMGSDDSIFMPAMDGDLGDVGEGMTIEDPDFLSGQTMLGLTRLSSDKVSLDHDTPFDPDDLF